MADVIVTLALERKSGILAAAISSLARAGLEFQSHRFEKGGADAAHSLELIASGEPGDAESLAEELSRVRGVSRVDDIRVDGRSQLGAEEGPEDGEAAADGAPANEAPPPEPDPEPETEPEPEPESSETASAASAGSTSGQSTNPEPQAGPESEQDRPDPDSAGDLRPSMRRRRRRRR